MSKYLVGLTLSTLLSSAPEDSISEEKKVHSFPPALFTSFANEFASDKECTPLDILFLVDTTSSMGGVFPAMKEEIRGASYEIAKHHTSVRYALSTVGDFTDRLFSIDIPYNRVRDFSFDPQHIEMGLHFIIPYGGGDIPEAYPYALARASEEKWRPNATRMVVLFADSYAKNNVSLKKSVDNANYDLVTVTPPEMCEYWQNYSSTNFLLGDDELTKFLMEYSTQLCRDQPLVCKANENYFKI